MTTSKKVETTLKMYYNSIPEVGGCLRSPIRDTLVNEIVRFIEGETEVIDGKIERVIEGIYEPGKKWRNMTDDTLLLLRNQLVNKKSVPSFAPWSNISVLSLVNPVCNYLESYGLDVPNEFKTDFLATAINSLNIYNYEEFLIYVRLHEVIAEAEVFKLCGSLKEKYVSVNLIENAQVHIYETFVIVVWDDDETYSIYSYDMLLSWRDLMLKRSIALLLSETLFNEMGTGYPNVKTVRAVLDWGSCVLEELGNEGYSIIANYESLITGTILRKYDDFDNSMFLDTIVGEIEGTGNNRLIDKTREMIGILEDCKDCQIVQCFGLFKVWSYPVVNEKEAMSALVEYGRCEKKVNQEVMSYLDAICRRQFFLSYRQLHNRDPPNAYYLGKKTDHLYKVVEKKWKYDDTSKYYNVLQWRNVKVRGSLDPIFDVDIGSYMKDRAISPELHQLWTVYNSVYIAEEVKSDIGCKVRAGIQRFLQGDILSAKNLVDYVSMNGADEAWKVVGVTAKEKEHKPTARLFAMLTLHMKLWFAVTEDCLKTALFPFFPQQSMDQTSTQASRKKSKMANVESSDVIKIVMNIDFSKWNTTFRDENTYFVFLFIDEVFDFTNVYTYTHQFFKSCRIYISSRFCVPEILSVCTSHSQSLDPDTNDTTWFHGFLGGFEGQRQKGWTLVTLLLMIYVIEIQAKITDYELYGQGDNQVLCIIFKKKNLRQDLRDYKNQPIKAYQDQIKEKIEYLKKKLEHSCLCIGLKVKIEETWFSNSFFQYSKDFYIKGAKMPLDYKQMMTISPHTTLICPTQEQIFQNLTSALTGCLDSCHSPLATFLCGMYICGVLMLHHDQRYNMSGGYSSNESHYRSSLRSFQKLIQREGEGYLSMMMIVPSCLGGMSDFRIGSIIRKGAGDHVEASLDFIMRSKDSRLLNYLANLLSIGMQHETNTDRSILLSNPLSLNLYINNISSGIRRGTLDYLKANASGIIRRALEAYDSAEHLAFKKNLIPDKGWDPIAAQLMYALSAYAPIASQIERLDGSSLTRLIDINVNGLLDSVDATNKAKIRHFKILTSKDNGPISPERFNPIYSEALARKFRGFWGLQELVLPINKFDPDIVLMSQSRLKEYNSPCDMRTVGDILLMVKNNDEYNLKTTRGPFKPKTRLTNVPDTLTTNIEIAYGMVSRNIESLADVYNSLVKNEELGRKISSQVNTVTDFNIVTAVDQSNQRKTLLLETCEPSSSSNFSTHVKIYKSEYVRSKKDDDIRFQYSKAIAIGTSLLDIQYSINLVCDAVLDKSYWIICKGGFNKINRPKYPYDFTPSLLTYPNNEMYFAKSTEVKYRRNLRSMKTDSILRCAMIIDSSFAKSGLLDGSGILKHSAPYQSIEEPVTLYSTMVVLRYLMYKRFPLTISSKHLIWNINQKGNREPVHDAFKWFLTDSGCISVISSGIPSFFRLCTFQERVNALITHGLSCAKKIYHSYHNKFCRLFPLYDRSECQYRFVFEYTTRFLLTQPNLEINTIDFSLENESFLMTKVVQAYTTPMVNYGKKHALIFGKPKKITFHDLAYSRMITPEWTERMQFEHNSLCYNQYMKGIGLFMAVISLIQQFRYEIVAFNIDVFDNSVTTIFRNLMKGKNLHGKMNCTIVCYYIDKSDKCVYTSYGSKSLELTNHLEMLTDIIDACKDLTDNLLYVGFASGMDDLDSLIYGKRSDYHNIGSVFTDILSFEPKNKTDRYFKYTEPSWSASSLIPDWCLTLIVIEDIKSLRNIETLPTLITSESLNELLNENGYRTYDDIIEEVQDKDKAERIWYARESIEDVRIGFIASRFNITESEVRSKGGYHYSPSRVNLDNFMELANCISDD